MVEAHNRHRVITTPWQLLYFFFCQGLISSELRRILEKRPSSRSSEEVHYVSLLIFSTLNIVILYVFWHGLRATCVMSNPKTNTFPHAALVRESGKTHFVFGTRILSLEHAFCLGTRILFLNPWHFFIHIKPVNEKTHLSPRINWAF